MSDYLENLVITDKHLIKHGESDIQIEWPSLRF